MTVWLIGESPTRYTTEPFAGRSGSKMSAMAGFNVRQVFKCTNVLEEYPGKGRKGALFPIEEARRGAVRILTDPEFNPETDRLILVGGRVAKKAFQLRDWVEHYQWTTLQEGTAMALPRACGNTPVCFIPHPTGLNRHWNDPANIQRFKTFMQSET